MRPRLLIPAVVVLALTQAATVQAQRSASLGRFSLFYNLDRRTEDAGGSTDFSLLTAYIDLHSPAGAETGFEYSIDARATSYPSSDRHTRMSVYDAYVGGSLLGGKLGVRLGQMWFNDLGALGSVGGAGVEYRYATAAGTRYRAGLFAGLEPLHFDTGYADGVRKGGVWAAYDGHAARRHVLGFVAIRNEGVKERSVLSSTNFIPAGKKLFLYQIAEYDLHGPGGEGGGDLSYFFATARVLPAAALEVQLNYHQGRSIDARSITNDIIDGRPVDPRLLEGYLFESAGGRVTVTLSRTVRVYAAYAQDQNNRDEAAYPHLSGGISVRDVLGSGIDMTTYASRVDRTQGPYTSVYASLGRSLGTRWYMSLDYTSSLSVLRISSGGGPTVETRPQADRYSLMMQVNLGRRFSLFLNLERVDEDAATEDRLATGLSVRF
jgi:hypothetical protein